MAIKINPFPSGVRRIGVCSPGSVPDRERIELALDIIHSFGIETRLTEHVFSPGEDDYSAADEDKRLGDLNSLIRDTDIDLIYCARGGYGSTRLLAGMDYDTLRKRGLPVCGYSDITAIHSAMLAKKAGQVIYCKVLAEFPKVFDYPLTCTSFAKNFARMEQTAALERITPSAPKDITGRVIAANLSVFAALTGTEYMPDTTGTVIILEDVGEHARKIDRALLHLAMTGTLEKAAAVVFASYTDCDATCDALERIFRRFAKSAKCPCFKGFEYGHDFVSHAMRGGAPCVIKADGTMIF